MDYAARELDARGVTVTRTPNSEVTHLLLPVPCNMSEEDLEHILRSVSKDVIVFGGYTDRNELSAYTHYDLLKDAAYLAANANITAHCAMAIAAEKLPITWENCPVLITGWGRIGKCLGSLLKNAGADVAIAARKSEDLGMIRALGYEAENINELTYILKGYRVIFNTVPAPILFASQLAHCRPDCLKMELASKPGILSDDVVSARGLPGKYAPESSGKLIASTALRMCARREVQK